MEKSERAKPSFRGVRLCSRSGCRNIASRTLIYVYSESTALLGPLATFAEPHSYDLCDVHTTRLNVPVGWTMINKVVENQHIGPSEDDIMAIADAVREVGKRPDVEELDAQQSLVQQKTNEIGRRGHLRSVSN